MTQIEEYARRVEDAVSGGRLREALRLLAVMAPSPAENPILRSEIARLEEDYDRVIAYALTGNPDPGRQDQLRTITNALYSLLDLTLRHANMKDTSSLYFNTARTEQRLRNDSISALAEAMQRATAAAGAYATATLSKAEAKARHELLDKARMRFFERVWVSVPLSSSDRLTLLALAADDPVGAQVAISALTLGGIQFYSEEHLLLLLTLAANDSLEPAVKQRALVGAVMMIVAWPNRSNSIKVTHLLNSLRENPAWQRSVEEIFFQLIRTSGIDKYTKTIVNDIIPEMMKLRPEIYKGLDPSAGINFDENPEWEELLERTGLSDKLRRLNEQQEEGGDMLYPLFSQLKVFPFFNHPAHWFLPFDAEHPEVAEAIGHDYALAELLSVAPNLTDSDKYSFALALNHIPAQQREMLTSQIQQSNINLAELSSTELLPEERRRVQQMVMVIQDLYRFFTLFRRKGEFQSPFLKPVNPVEIPALAPDFLNSDKLRLMGEFFFKHGQWKHAETNFAYITPPDAASLQKRAHALRKLGRYQEAVEVLTIAADLAPNSLWTLRQLASSLRICGQPKEALEVYKRIEVKDPDSPQLALDMGYCNLDLARYHEALHCFYKAEFLDEASLTPIRPIARAAFLNRDFDTADRYYTRLMQTTTPAPDDYLHMGHLALAMGRVRDALNLYRLARPQAESLRPTLLAELPLLEAAGVDTSIIPLLLDA